MDNKEAMFLAGDSSASQEGRTGNTEMLRQVTRWELSIAEANQGGTEADSGEGRYNKTSLFEYFKGIKIFK